MRIPIDTASPLYATVALTVLLGACAVDGTASPGEDTSVDPEVTVASSPCAWENPPEVGVDQEVADAVPSTDCDGPVHFYRFVPEVPGTYIIAKAGGGDLGICQDGAFEGGCICAPANCCLDDCEMTFEVGPSGPSAVGDPVSIYVDGTWTPGEYTFTIRAPGS